MNNRLLSQFTKIFLVTLSVLSVTLLLLGILVDVCFPKIYRDLQYDHFNYATENLYSEMQSARSLSEALEISRFYEVQDELYTVVTRANGEHIHSSGYISALQKHDAVIVKQDGDEIIMSLGHEKQIRYFKRTYTIQVEDKTFILSVFEEIYTEDELKEPLRGFYAAAVISNILIAIIISFIITYFFRKPISILANKAKAISELDFENDYRWNSNDDMGHLSSSLDKMQEKLKYAMKFLEDDSFLKNELLLEEQKQRIAILSHELNTPLTVLKMQNEMLLETDQNEMSRMYIERNLQKVNEIEKLVDHILRQEDIDAKETIEINELIDNLIKYDFDSSLFKFEYIDKCYVEGSMIYVKRLLINLIGNSIKYNVDNQPIIIRIEKHSFTIINKCNSDINKSQILKPYVRGNVSDDIPGQGLGLYICSKICALQHFKFFVETENNEFKAKIKFKLR